MNQLSIDTYLANSNHYTIQDWVVTTDCLEEVLEKDFDKQWFSYYRAKGYIEEEVPEDLLFEFHDNIQENDFWLSINKDLFIVNDFCLSAVFISAFIDELDTEDDEKFKMFVGFITNKKNMFLRFRKFPRRIDLFPIKESSIAQQILDNLNEDGKELFKYSN